MDNKQHKSTQPPATIADGTTGKAAEETEIEINLGAAVDVSAVEKHAIKLNLPSEVEKRVPWECYGFQLDAGSREYDRKSGDAIVGSSLRVANVICKLKGSSEDAPFYFLCNISRIKSAKQGEAARVTVSLPSNQKGGNSFASAVIKPGTTAARAAQEAWKNAILVGPFAAWIAKQDMTAFMRNANALTMQGVALQIPGLTD